MAKKQERYKHYSVMATTAGAGALVSGSNSQDTAGTGNYVKKENFRRESDGEVRREGWDQLQIDETIVDQLNSENAPVRLLDQFESEGKNVIVAGAGDKLFRFREDTNQWVEIAKGLYNLDEFNYDAEQIFVANRYKLKARRWESIAIDGYIIFNNGVDLPLYYREDWPCAFPMYSIRERGIVRAGTITEFDGRLFVADVEYFDETIQYNFSYFMATASSPYKPPENFADYDVYTTTYRVPHTIEFSAWRLATDSKDARSAPHLFGQNYEAYAETVTYDGVAAEKYLTEIGVNYPMGGTELRPILYFTGFTVSNANGWYTQDDQNPDIYYNRGALGLAPNDWTLEKVGSKWVVRDNIAPVTDPYFEQADNSTPPNVGDWYRANDNGSGTINYTYDQTGVVVVSSYELDAQTSFNPYFDSSTLFQTAISTGVDTLSYDWSTVVIGDGIRAIITSSIGAVKTYDLEVTDIVSSVWNGTTQFSVRPLINGTSAGQPMPVTDGNYSLDSIEFILLKEPDILSSDTSISREAADSMSFPEDGTTISKMAKLSDKLIVHRQTGYLSISRGTGASPFFYEEKYRGERVADFRNTVINIDSQRQMFAGFNGVYTITPASVEPEPFGVFMNGPEFWRASSTDKIEFIYTCENNLTQEVHLNCLLSPNAGEYNWTTLSYDMIRGTLSEMDYSFSAMTSVFPTESLDSRKFIMACHVVEASSISGIPIHNPAKFFDSELITPAEAALTNTGPRLVQYGYGVLNGQPYRVFHRSGLDYDCTLTFGKSDFGDKFSEKKMRSYAIHMSDIFTYAAYSSSGYTEDNLTIGAPVASVKLSTYSTSQQTEIEEVTQALEDLSAEVMIPVFAQGNYYQDRIILNGHGRPFKILGRTFEVSGVRTRMASEAVTDAA